MILVARAFWRQHPYRNLETLPNWIHDTDRTVTALGTTNDLQNGATKRMKRIVNLDVRIFRAQGIVSADVIIRMSIASFPPAGSLSISPPGSAHAAGFFLAREGAQQGVSRQVCRRAASERSAPESCPSMAT